MRRNIARILIKKGNVRMRRILQNINQEMKELNKNGIQNINQERKEQ